MRIGRELLDRLAVFEGVLNTIDKNPLLGIFAGLLALRKKRSKV